VRETARPRALPTHRIDKTRLRLREHERRLIDFAEVGLTAAVYIAPNPNPWSVKPINSITRSHGCTRTRTAAVRARASGGKQ
jgi:hypothetical protein